MSSAVRIVEKQLDEILAIAKNPAQRPLLLRPDEGGTRIPEA